MEGFLVKQKPNLITAPSPTGGQPNESGCFDCNICLDTAHDPVVTLCGHLFCWPCIYKWLHVKLSSVSINQNTCPVCKSSVTVTSLVPLYGRGMSSTFSSKNSELTDLPRRPTPSTSNNPATSQPSLYPRLPHQTPSPHPTFHNSPRAFTTTYSTDLASAVMMSFLYPVIGMFGDLVYTRIFGTFTNTTIAQPYQNQRMMQREKSLNRVSIFLSFCILLCLLLF